MIRHLVHQLNPVELGRLLVRIPEKYMDAISDAWEDNPDKNVAQGLRQTFWVAFERASSDLQKATVAKYVSILKSESTWHVRTYEDAFVQMRYLEFLEPPERDMVKSHLLHRVLKGIDGATLDLLEIPWASYLSNYEVGRVLDLLIRAAVLDKDPRVRDDAELAVLCSYQEGNLERNTEVVKKLRGFHDQYQGSGNRYGVEVTDRLAKYFEETMRGD